MNFYDISHAAGVGAVAVSSSGLSMASEALGNAGQDGAAEPVTLEVNQGWPTQDLEIKLRNDSN